MDSLNGCNTANNIHLQHSISILLRLQSKIKFQAVFNCTNWELNGTDLNQFSVISQGKTSEDTVYEKEKWMGVGARILTTAKTILQISLQFTACNNL